MLHSKVMPKFKHISSKLKILTIIIIIIIIYFSSCCEVVTSV